MPTSEIDRRKACGLLVSGAIFASLGSAARATTSSPALTDALRRLTDGPDDVSAFYAARGHRPLWFAEGNANAPARLIQLISGAALDGLDPREYQPQALIDAAKRAPAATDSLARAEVMFARAFVRFAQDVGRPREAGVTYVDEALRPKPPAPAALLSAAADAPSLGQYLEDIGWMHPVYGGLRGALANLGEIGSDPLFADSARRLRVNMERASILPRTGGRYVLVDAAAAKLYYYERGQVRDTMRVVVGTRDMQTPMMAALIRYASLNPYWHVPPDLTRDRIAPRVLSEGLSYFVDRGYEVVSEWSRAAAVLDPGSVDWKAVASGRREIFVRQRPGPNNSMGNVKYMFPNKMGIYLHDTPTKGHFEELQRLISAGCVRLEDSTRLGKLLFGRALETQSAEPEQVVPLPAPVPVYLTYLTAAPERGRIVERPDVYKRDAAQHAALAKQGAFRRLDS